MLAKAGGHVRLGSRQKAKAEAACTAIKLEIPDARIEAVATAESTDGPAALKGRDLVIAAGAPSVLMLPLKQRKNCKTLKVAIDLNGVPPAGIEGIELNDKATNRHECLAYGALGVGSTKMKVHKAALEALFEKSDAIFDIDAIYEIAKSIG